MNFGTAKISTLFTKLLVPTLLGMVFTSIFIVVDGMMVGRGVGSNGLAAVNIVSPLFTLSTGIGLMFGIGGSVLASVSLSKNKAREASMYTGFSLLIASVISFVTLVLILSFGESVAKILATPPELMDYTMEYLRPLAPTLFFNVILTAGLFFIRLDGSPNFAMVCISVGAVINIVLDYLFIFEFGWGLFGAGFATMLAQLIGAVMMLIYMFRFARNLRIARMPLKWKSLRMVLKSSVAISSLGFSAFLGDLAISLMVIVGNITFIHYIGVDGVAAFSVVCFFFPTIFMAYNAIIQSAQPIISFNYATNKGRANRAMSLALRTTVVSGIIFSVGSWVGREGIVAMFLAPGSPAYDIAVDGIGWFGLGFLFFGLNILATGVMQSIGQARKATMLTVVRGGVLMLVSFLVLPMLLGDVGIWLAVPVAELATFVLVLIVGLKSYNASTAKQ